MKKSINNLLFITLLLLISFEVIKENQIVISSVRFSLKIWQENIFPSLFPFFIISNILISLHFPEILGEIFKNLMHRLFKINSNTTFILFLSILSGFPSSAKYTKELLKKKLIDNDDATKILTFTHFSNPLFVISTLKTFINDNKIILIVLLSHYLSNFIIGLLFRNYKCKNIYLSKSNISNVISLPTENFGIIITKSITSAINALLLILGTVSTFLIITTLINDIFQFNGIARAIINGLFEITQGLKSLEYLYISNSFKGLISTFILSFGGLSVHMQIITIISDTKIKYLPYFISRVLHAFLSILIFYLLNII